MTDPGLSGTSAVIPVGIKKDGNFYAHLRVGSEDQFGALFQHLREQAISLGTGGRPSNYKFPRPIKSASRHPFSFANLSPRWAAVLRAGWLRCKVEAKVEAKEVAAKAI